MTRHARMIAHATGQDGLGPDDLGPSAALDEAPSFAELEAEARAAADADPVARHDLAYLTPELMAGAALTRANLTAQKAEAIRPRTREEAAQAYDIAKAGAARLGFETVAAYLDAVDPLPPPRRTTGPEPFPEPEDRGTATLSTLGEVEYVDDLIRPGRIVVVAAEEGAGKSYAIGGELAVRVAVAGGSFAGTWPLRQTGPVLYMSEMHADDDFGREATVLSSLKLDRPVLAGRYYRLPLMTAAGGRPALMVPEWRAWATGWLRDRKALLLIVDTATGATQVDPWGSAIQAVYAGLRIMLADLIEHWRPEVVVRESLEFSSLAAAAAQGVPHIQVAANLLVTLEDVMARIRPRVIELLATAGVGADRSSDAFDERLLSLVPPSLERPDDRDRAARYRARDVGRSVATNGHRPLVFLSLGTEAAGQFYPALYRDAIDAIADGSRDVLVTLGRAVDPAALGRLPEGVRVKPWVDQAEVLSRTAVSVCHGGTGTVIGSLAAGVPVVVLPLFSMDHWQTGARVAEAGAGIVLDGPGDVAQLGPAVREVLEQPRFRERAGELARETASLPPASDAVRALEAIPARGA